MRSEEKKRIDNDKHFSVHYLSLFTHWNGEILFFYYFFSAKGGYIDRLWWLCTDFGLNRYSGFWYDESSFVEVDMSKCVNTFIREYITHHALVSFSVVAG